MYKKSLVVDKNKIIKQQGGLISLILAVAAIILLLTSLFIKDDSSANIFITVGFGFLISNLLFRVFKGKIGYKPTREEIEEKMFGGDKKN